MASIAEAEDRESRLLFEIERLTVHLYACILYVIHTHIPTRLYLSIYLPIYIYIYISICSVCEYIVMYVF